MSTKSLIVSATARRRIDRATAWLESWAPADELLIVGSNLDAANEIARTLVYKRGAAFGHHRLSFTQLAAAMAATGMAARRLVPLGSLGVQAITARIVNDLAASGRLDAALFCSLLSARRDTAVARRVKSPSSVTQPSYSAVHANNAGHDLVALSESAI